MADDKKETFGTWMGRKPKGQQDEHSWQSFLKKTNGKVLQGHLQRHHKGYGKKT